MQLSLWALGIVRVRFAARQAQMRQTGFATGKATGPVQGHDGFE
jgi:hypothetical protein